MSMTSTEIITASSNKAGNVLSQDCKETPTLLYDGAFTFFKSSHAPSVYTRLHLYTVGSEALAIVSNLPVTIGQREAAEQIVATFSLEPDKLMFLDRIPAASNGNGPLKRDLYTKYIFDWKWSGMWKATNTTYCYRVSGEQETRATHLLTESARVPAESPTAVVVTQEAVTQ
jgi:hypothetical protein